ncbi:DUF3892 domain-containing protein [Bacillus andreraoultii]|uniref:DUF3892 domain-containing protein n=1 Tax=Bacillus andreraoultii TaxID=1499685 RepID=UPI000539AD02|nr:DUF3892 domain-containing protein [Bacillus andreraoultii]
MEEIIAVDKNYKGDIISFKTSTGRVISYLKAMEAIEQGEIVGAKIIETNDFEQPFIIQAMNSTDQYFDNYPPIF